MLACLASGLAGLSCMGPDDYRDEADEAAYGVVSRAREAAGQDPDPAFSIDVDSSARRRDLLPTPASEDAVQASEKLALTDRVVATDLESALRQAAESSREFQDQRERLYDRALALTSVVHDFENNYSGLIGMTARSQGDGESDATVSVAESSELGFTRMLESGGRFAISIGNNLTRFLTNPASTAATTFLSLSLSLPLLRGAGRDIAYEGVTQSERDVIYAVRDFERFKRSFAVDVTSDYLRLLQSLKTVENERANFERRQVTADENRFLGQAGRIARTDVERANQALLAAENRWINARQSHESNLDRFKLRLGLPTDCALTIEIADLAKLQQEGIRAIGLEERDLLILALENRLDLATAEGRVHDAARKVVVAADALDAGLDFRANVDLDSDDFAKRSFKLDPIGDQNSLLGLDLDLPFDRLDERNAYRRALINYEAAKRDYEAFEDQVKLEIRRDLRSLKQTAESYRIQVESEKVARTNEDAANLLKASGQGNTNDLLDAQNDLIAAQNAVIQALIDYTIARLQMLRDLDLLVVGPEGIDRETTEKLLHEGR